MFFFVKSNNLNFKKKTIVVPSIGVCCTIDEMAVILRFCLMIYLANIYNMLGSIRVIKAALIQISRISNFMHQEKSPGKRINKNI